jgi:hypothetical protein
MRDRVQKYRGRGAKREKLPQTRGTIMCVWENNEYIIG